MTAFAARTWAEFLRRARELREMPSREAREQRLLFDTIALGIIAALAAQVFNWLLAVAGRLLLGGITGYTPPGLPNEGGTPAEVIGAHGVWLVPVVTALGGLAVGWLTTRFAPEAEGHGTDAAIKAFHRADGQVRARVPIVKLLASTITIGTGGVAGREGPMALITGGLGSWYAGLTGRDGRERRLLLLVGMAAGLSAIFRSPIGAAIFAIEVLYSDIEFEPGALVYTAIGSIVAYAVNGLFVGWVPLFAVSSLVGHLTRPIDYGWYVVLGLAAGLIATLLPMVFYRTRDWFVALPVKAYWRPAIGGLFTGLIALSFTSVIGGGYGWIQQSIDGQMAVGLMVVLVFAKMFAMSFTVASGGSGGVFAPTLFMGAMLGGLCAAVAHQPPAPFVVVGMAAVFAGAAHVPIATMMMVTEMTGGYTLLVPATLAVVLSYLMQIRLSKRNKYRSIYEAQVTSRADSPAHHAKHLEIAMRILREKGVGSIANTGPLDLLSALRTGIPVQLPGERKVMVGVLRPESTLCTMTVSKVAPELDRGELRIIAVLRKEHMLAPRADLALEPGDRLILLASAASAELFKTHFTPW